MANALSADNISIKNCILNGNVTAGNASAITSTSSSSNSSFGIYCGGNGGTTAIDAPTAITSVTSNSAPSGTTINSLLIDNNAVNQCARGIVFIGAATTVSTGVTITNNSVGEQTTAVLDQIEAALQLAGSSLANCVKANVYLKNLDDYQAMNAAYLGRFGDQPPVRTTVAVAGIPLDGCLVEIECIAHR